MPSREISSTNTRAPEKGGLGDAIKAALACVFSLFFSLFATSLPAVVIIGFLGLYIVPLSLYYADHLAASAFASFLHRAFWWIFAFILGSGACLTVCVSFGAVVDSPGNAFPFFLPACICVPLFLGMVFLQKGSWAFTSRLDYDLTAASMLELYENQASGLLVFKAGQGGGYVNEGSTWSKTWDVSIPCHGVWVTKECTRSSCTPGGKGQSETCTTEHYDCSGYEWYDTCPGFAMAVAAPYFSHEDQAAKEGSPVAFMFQYQVFFFNDDNQEGLEAQKRDELARKKFSKELCEGDNGPVYCAVDLRWPQSGQYWNGWYGVGGIETRNFSSAVAVQSECGVVNPSDILPDAWEAYNRGRSVSDDAATGYGLSNMEMPLLWMPSGGTPLFKRHEEVLVESEHWLELGSKMLIYTGSALAVLIVVAGSLAIMSNRKKLANSASERYGELREPLDSDDESPTE